MPKILIVPLLRKSKNRSPKVHERENNNSRWRFLGVGAGAESKGFYYRRITMWPPGTATNLGLLGAEGVPRILAALVARDDRLTILNAKLTTGH
jgi:hypothetical protein